MTALVGLVVHPPPGCTVAVLAGPSLGLMTSDPSVGSAKGPRASFDHAALLRYDSRPFSNAAGMSGGGERVVLIPSMPSEKALGSLRPLMRWKPLSPVAGSGPLSASCLFLNLRPPKSGASTGAKPVRCFILGPPLAAPGPPARAGVASPLVSGCMLAMRFRYQRRKTTTTRSTTASPATPPTMPPASSEVGGVLLVLSPLEDSVDEEVGAEEVVEPAIEAAPVAPGDEATVEVADEEVEPV